MGQGGQEMSYASLHQHSDASFLDSCNKPDELAQKAKSVGMKAIALTDHGNVHNFIKMNNACKKHGVKFIPGCEFYFTYKHDDKERKSRHITILCMNNTGLQTIYKLTTMANTPVDQGGGFFYRPRVDWSDLEQNNEGLICLTGCMNSPVNHEFGRNNDYNAGKEHTKHLLGIFGKDRLFVELQMVNDPLDRPQRKVYIPEQDIIFEWDKRVASELGLRTVATNDSHYLNKEDSFAHEILKCLDAKATLKTPVVDHKKGVTRGRLVFSGFDYHVKSKEEMREKFTEKEIDMSQTIADMCNVDFNINPRMPLFEKDITPEKAYDKLVDECRKGWSFRKIGNKKDKKTYENRIKTELKDTKEANLANYLLIVWDVLRFCRSESIPVGPGRGSAAGSLICYLLRITQVDPIKHGLIWERFWNRGRVGSMPDIDVDVSIKHKERVVEYIKEKFGRDRVFPMMTIGTMATANVLKDVGKSIGLTFAYMNELTKHLPHKVKNIEDAIDRSEVVKEASKGIDKETKAWQDNLNKINKDPNAIDAVLDYSRRIADRSKMLQQTFQVAKRLEGCSRQRGTHACALLIADRPVTGDLPLCWDAKKKQFITGFDMYDLDELGFLKLDILGLKTLDVIADCHPDGPECLYDPDSYFGPWDDKKVYQMFAKGRTKGVFQLESPLGKAWCKRMHPKSQNELSDLVSLIRPAVLEIGMADEYLKNRKDPSKITYIHKDLEKIMETTYGCQVYQEQMIQMVQDLAGWDLAEADGLRKAVGKKIPEKLAAMKDKFRDGVKNVTGNKALADELWGWIEKGAEYGFNKSHAMCYGGYLGYITAYMKIHFAAEFFLALLKFSKTESDSQEEILEIFYDSKLFGITIKQPNVAKGNIDFELEDKNIYFGLSHIKHIGNSSVKNLKNLGNLDWFRVLLDRGSIGLKKDVFLALILSGAFDYLSLTRRNMRQQFNFIENLTDKEIDVFRKFLTGGTIEKETKKSGKMQFTIGQGYNPFPEAVTNFRNFLAGYNATMKVVNARRTGGLHGVCNEFLSEYNEGNEYGPREKAGYETYYLSVPVTCSEVDIYSGDHRKTHHLIEVEREFDKVGCAVIALINKINERKDKKGRPMAFIGIQDKTYQLDGVMFSHDWLYHKSKLEVGKVVLLEGKKSRGGFQICKVEEL